MAAIEQIPTNRNDFARYKEERMKEYNKTVRSLTIEFNEAKDKLLQSKKELKYWQKITFEEFVIHVISSES